MLVVMTAFTKERSKQNVLIEEMEEESVYTSSEETLILTGEERGLNDRGCAQGETLPLLFWGATAGDN